MSGTFLDIYTESDVSSVLADHRPEVMDVVRSVYALHHDERAVVPLSQFTRPDPGSRDRYIALSAHLRGAAPIAGLKFISSFPGNRARGLPRASAVIVLADPGTGRPTALLEAGGISAARTAASAAVAARALHASSPQTIGLVAAGRINTEVCSYLACGGSGFEVVVYDTDPGRSIALSDRLCASGLRARVGDLKTSLGCDVVSIATDSIVETIPDGHAFRSDQTVLHLSLRDLSVRHALAAWNVVDDPEHVLREDTTLDRASRLGVGRSVVHATIGGVLAGGTGRDPGGRHPTVFSPFGLGSLDIAVADFVRRRLDRRSRRIRIEEFFAPCVQEGVTT